MKTTVNERLTQFYKNYNASMIDVANKILLDEHLAKDVSHDIFVKMSDEWILKEMPGKDRKCYLLVAAAHRALDYKKKRERFSPIAGLFDIGVIDENLLAVESAVDYEIANNAKIFELIISESYGKIPEGMEFNGSFLNKIFLALRMHNKNWHRILIRSELYHMPVELIAKELNMSTSAVRIGRYRAKGWLKKNFGEEYKLVRKTLNY